MVKEFRQQNASQVEKADRQEVMPGNTSDVTVHSDSWTEIYTEASTNTKRYAPGYGFGNRNSSDAGFADYNPQNSGGSDLDGNFRWVLYESSDHDVPIRMGSTFSASALRASESESLRDKQIMPGQVPRGAQDRELVLEFKASSGNDGDTYSASNSSAEQGIPYSRFRV
jgi:hypothetical protein